MNFDFSLEDKQLRDMVRRHTEEEMRPHVAEADYRERFPDGLLRRAGANVGSSLRVILRRMASSEWTKYPTA